MESRPTQFGVRENTASTRQHASRRSRKAPAVAPDLLPVIDQDDTNVKTPQPPHRQTIGLQLPEPNQGTTGGRDNALTLVGGTTRPGLERAMTCEEAAAFVRVHPKTIKRMARNGEVPGHFRFGRWFFYASELDCWMRTELHSVCHP